MKDITPAQNVSPLRKLREDRGMSREELAFRAHVSKETIERLERLDADSTPHRLTRRSIVAALGCEPAELGWPEEPQEQAA